MAPKANKECSDDLDGSSDSGPTRVYAPSDPQRLCVVCGACASGRHFGAYTCESCKLFFLRLTQGKNARPLKCGNDERCNLESRLRSVCRLCRYKKCIESGMSKDRIVYGRNARSSQKYSTPRKQRIHSAPIIHSSSQVMRPDAGFQCFSNPGSAPTISNQSSPSTSTSYGSSTRSVMLTDCSQENVVNTSMVDDTPPADLPGIEGELFLELPDPDCFQPAEIQPPYIRTKQERSFSPELFDWLPGQTKDPDDHKSSPKQENNNQCCNMSAEKSGREKLTNQPVPINPLNYCHLSHEECERFANCYNIFTVLSTNWLPKIELSCTHSDLGVCLQEVQSFTLQFISFEFLPGSLAFQNLAKMSCNFSSFNQFDVADPGKVIFPIMSVLLVLPFVDVLYKRMEHNDGCFDDCLLLGSRKFWGAVNALRKLQMTQCEYATLLNYFAVQMYAAEPTKQHFLRTHREVDVIKSEANQKCCPHDSANSRNQEWYQTLSTELCYMNNIMISVFGAYSHLKYFEVFNDLLSCFAAGDKY